MLTPNLSYANLKESYLFYHIAKKTLAYLEANPGSRLYRMGIGDVSLPLVPAVIQALHSAVDDQAAKDSFHGYMPECGDPADTHEAASRLNESWGRVSAANLGK